MDKSMKASPAETGHVREAQSGIGCNPGKHIEAVFENTCEWCDYRYACGKTHIWVGIGLPAPS